MLLDRLLLHFMWCFIDNKSKVYFSPWLFGLCYCFYGQRGWWFFFSGLYVLLYLQYACKVLQNISLIFSLVVRLTSKKLSQCVIHDSKGGVCITSYTVFLGTVNLTFFLHRCATEEGCDELQIASSPDYEQNKHVFSGPTGRWIDVEIPGQSSGNNRTTSKLWIFSFFPVLNKRKSTFYFIISEAWLKQYIESKLLFPFRFRWHVVLHLQIRQQYKRLGLEICSHWWSTWQVTWLN